MVEKSPLHLVWDWNGTVLNDFDVSIRSTNSSFRDAGLPEITTATYRALLRTPIRSFYAAVLDRDPSDEECDVLDHWRSLAKISRPAALNLTGHRSQRISARPLARKPRASPRPGCVLPGGQGGWPGSDPSGGLDAPARWCFSVTDGVKGRV